MTDGTLSVADGLGAKTIDSHELLKKSKALHHNSSPPSKPSFQQSNVYPLRAKPRSAISPCLNIDPPTIPPISDKPNQSNLLQPVRDTRIPSLVKDFTHSQIPTEVQNPNSPPASLPQPVANSELQYGPHSPTVSVSSPSRILQQVFHEAGDRTDSSDRLGTRVNSIEEEMQNSGVKVNISKFKEHRHQLQEAGPGSSTGVDLEGEYVSVPEGKAPTHPPESRTAGRSGAQTRKWTSLFQAQAPAKSMRLAHYPELQKGKAALINFEESQIDDGVGKNCLVGHFLDGKMPMPLLSATAHAVWKDHGKFSIKQLGSCYLFEFEDEAAKLAVLEGGPYFFSRRYLVLKEWTRLLVPGKMHPSTIPVWIKIHRLPLEFWTHVGFSMIASAIGKPICVDEATTNKKRLDYARICVEINAGDEHPNDITISVNDESVMVGVEYQ